MEDNKAEALRYARQIEDGVESIEHNLRRLDSYEYAPNVKWALQSMKNITANIRIDNSYIQTELNKSKPNLKEVKGFTGKAVVNATLVQADHKWIMDVLEVEQPGPPFSSHELDLVTIDPESGFLTEYIWVFHGEHADYYFQQAHNHFQAGQKAVAAADIRKAAIYAYLDAMKPECEIKK